MESKLIYIALVPWAKLAEFLNYCYRYVASSVYPSRDGKFAVVEYHPLPTEVLSLTELVHSYEESLKPIANGKKN